MKGVLLDTPALLWMKLGDRRLSRKARVQIEQRDDLIYSIISFWEIALKLSRGGFDFELPGAWHQELLRELREIRVRRIGLEVEHCRRLQDLPWHHQDPFDRMLIAQAQAEDFAILAGDPSFAQYDVRVIW